MIVGKVKKNRTVENSGYQWVLKLNEFNIPYTLEWDCPQCEHINKKNFETDGLKFPSMINDFRELVECKKCDFTDFIMLQIDVILKVVK